MRPNLFLALFLLIGCWKFSHGQGTDEEPGCFDRGECLGSLVLTTWPTDDPQECLELCREYDGCEYFVHKGDDDDCFAFANCQEVSADTCDDCYLGRADCEDSVCWVRSTCQWELLSSADVAWEDDCLRLCKEEERCRWFTFQEADHACLLMEGCALADDGDCDTCWSGQSQCTERKDSPKVMVVAGYSSGYLDAVVGLDMTGGNCESIADYPLTMYGATAAVVNGVPRVCGGREIVEGQAESIESCYAYNQAANTWDPMDDMSEKRYQPKSSLLGTGTWLITGGYDIETELATDTSVVWTESDGFIPGPQLPEPLYANCQVSINSTHVFVGLQSAYLLDWNSWEWTILPDVPRGGGAGSCGYVVDADGQQEVVFVNDGATDILNLRDLEWRDGPPLPDLDQEAAYVQLKSSFLVISGQGYGEENVYLETIYEFEYDPAAADYVWALKAERLTPGRQQAVAMSIPDEMISC